MGLRSRAGKVGRPHIRPHFHPKFSFHFWDRDLATKLPHFLFQTGLATASLIIILLIENGVFRAAIVVAVGSTAYTIFVFPNSVVSTPRRTIGGHVAAVIAGLIFASLLMIPAVSSFTEQERIVRDMFAALSVGLSIMFMVATDTEHPPAAGTALAIVLHGMSISAILFILSSAIILSIVRIALRPKLVNLL